MKRKVMNNCAMAFCFIAVIVALVPLVSILLDIAIKGGRALNLNFFIHTPRPSGETGGGMANAIVGTLTLIGLASLWSIPLGILTGIYLGEFGSNRFGEFLRVALDVMGGIPSIVIGIFAYIIFVIPMKTFSAWAGGFALGIIMLPVVARTTEEMIRMVPLEIREAAWALGITPFHTIWHIVLRSAVPGIITGIILGIARIIGETAPLLFTAFGNMFWHHSLNQPIAALPLQVFTYAVSPYDDWHRQAWAGSFVMVLLVCIMSIIARLIIERGFTKTSLK